MYVCWILDVYESNGQFVCSFGEQILRYPQGFTTVSDGRVMVVQTLDPRGVHIFSEQGDYLNTFERKRCTEYPKIAFHRESQQVVVVGSEQYDSDILYLDMYTKDGDFVRSLLSIWESSFNCIGLQ